MAANFETWGGETVDEFTEIRRLAEGLVRRFPSLAVDPATLAILVADLSGEPYEVVESIVIDVLSDRLTQGAIVDDVNRSRPGNDRFPVPPLPKTPRKD